MNLSTIFLTTTLTFETADGVYAVGYKVVSGTVTITGNKDFKGLPSVPIEIPAGDTNMLSSINTPLDGITINANAGVVILEIYW